MNLFCLVSQAELQGEDIWDHVASPQFFPLPSLGFIPRSLSLEDQHRATAHPPPGLIYYLCFLLLPWSSRG